MPLLKINILVFQHNSVSIFKNLPPLFPNVISAAGLLVGLWHLWFCHFVYIIVTILFVCCHISGEYIAYVSCFCLLDTSQQTHVYRGCHNEILEDGCKPADVDELPADLYGVGIILYGTLCSCGTGLCNACRPTTDTAFFNLATLLIAVLTTLRVLLSCA